MSHMKLYTNQLCPYAHRVRLTLAEKGIDAELIEIDLKNKPSDFVHISPDGRVPLLLHRGAKIWGSAIINEYIDEVMPDPPLMPVAPADRALVRNWIKLADEQLYSTTHRFIFTREAEARRELVAQLLDHVQFLENEMMARRLHSGPYLFGDRFTLADIALYPWFEQSGVLQQLSEFRLPSDCRGLSEWRQAVGERKAVRQHARTTDWYAVRYRTYLAA